jgi:hypothetical protein
LYLTQTVTIFSVVGKKKNEKKWGKKKKKNPKTTRRTKMNAAV